MATDSKNVYQRLLEAQRELVAPREMSGRFGKARSAELILEAAKPVCRKHGLYLHTTDLIHDVNGRNYITATARVINVDAPDEIVEADASAWENEVSGGLDTSQVTGKTSSYAKKYALQNLFAIDDTKDADQDEKPAQPKTDVEHVKTAFPDAEVAYERQKAVTANGDDDKPTTAQLDRIREIREKLGYPASQTESKIKLLRTKSQAGAAVGKLKAELDQFNTEKGKGDAA